MEGRRACVDKEARLQGDRWRLVGRARCRERRGPDETHAIPFVDGECQST